MEPSKRFKLSKEIIDDPAERYCEIYKIMNLISGKIYVGQTYSTKSTYMGSGVFIKKAIKKYGKQNFLVL